MKTKKIFGIVLVILGVILLCGSFYIKSQVKAGQEKLSFAEETKDLGDKILSITPGTKEFGEHVTGSIQDKVREGKEQIAFYTTVANSLEIGGIISLILGIALFLICKKK